MFGVFILCLVLSSHKTDAECTGATFWICLRMGRIMEAHEERRAASCPLDTSCTAVSTNPPRTKATWELSWKHGDQVCCFSTSILVQGGDQHSATTPSTSAACSPRAAALSRRHGLQGYQARHKPAAHPQHSQGKPFIQKKNMASRSKNTIIHLHWALVEPYLACSLQLWFCLLTEGSSLTISLWFHYPFIRPNAAQCSTDTKPNSDSTDTLEGRRPGSKCGEQEHGGTTTTTKQETKNVRLKMMFQLVLVTSNCVTCIEHMGSARSCKHGTRRDASQQAVWPGAQPWLQGTRASHCPPEACWLH